MRVALGVSVLAVLLAACSSPDDGGRPVVPTATLPTITAEPPTWPGREWGPGEGEGFGDVDRTLAADASTCVVVVRDGVLVHEAAFAGTSPRTAVPVYSITKSVVALLVAVAVGDGDRRSTPPCPSTSRPGGAARPPASPCVTSWPTCRAGAGAGTSTRG